MRRGVWLAGLVASPVIVGLVYSFAGATGIAGFGAHGSYTLDRIRRVLSEQAVWESLWWTVRTSALATVLAGCAAVLAAALFRGTKTLDRAATTLAVLPLPIPHLVAAATAALVLGQSGLLARVAVTAGWISAPAQMPPLVYDRPGIGLILALGWKEFPFLALVAFSVVATRGAALEETARTLGAGPWQTFWRVTWPVLWRGLGPAAVAVFAFAAGSYETAALLGPSDPLPLPALTYERYTDADLARRGDAFVLSLLGLLLATGVVALHEWLRHRVRRLDG
ncbi:MAG TPA: ABC transporter permease subunit [Gemmatimonadales bacterium]|nr:ABC transporter permease subunit [Gemmatimonadales bacterium]